MALLVIDEEKQNQQFGLPLEKDVTTYIYQDEANTWHTSDSNVLSANFFHVVRANNGFYILISSNENSVTIREIPVLGLRFLRHNDTIQVAQHTFRFYEWLYHTITPQSPFFKQPCPFCKAPFKDQEIVMLCPKCDTVMHDYCWITRQEVGEGCIAQNCGYIPPEEKPYIPLLLPQ